MKILMICEFYNEDLDYQEILLAKYYSKLGHDVTVVTTPTHSVHEYISGRDRADRVSILQGKFARIIRVPIALNVAGRLRVFKSIRKIVEAERPDLLYFHDMIPNMVELKGYLNRNPRCCAIMDYHADYSNSGANWLSRLVLHRLIRRLIFATVRRRLSAILPVVPAARTFLRDLYGIPVEQTEVFPLGVDLDLAREMRTDIMRATVRETLGIPGEALVVFTGGKLVPPKRTEDVLHAAATIRDPQVHVIVVGDARDPAYQRQLEQASIGSKVHFVGWQDREGVYRHQAAADVAIFPASQSVLWQQSIGMGLPLVVGEGTGPAHMRQDVGYMNLANNIHVLNGQQALAPQIASFLRRCLHDRGMLERMSTGADAVTRELLSYERLASRTLEIAMAHRQATAQESEHA